MSLNLKMFVVAATLFLIAAPGAIAVAELPAQASQRDREVREAQERREREIRYGHPAPRELQEAEFEDWQRSLDQRVQYMHQELESLRAREINLIAALDTAGLGGRHEEVQQLQQELVHLRRDLQLRELEMDRFIRERDVQIERRELMRMTDRLAYVSNWRDVAFDPPQAVMMATQAIVELHLGAGESDRASDILEKLLEEVDELGSRTAIRFALKDVYREMGDHGRAAEQMALVIAENARACAAR